MIEIIPMGQSHIDKICEIEKVCFKIPWSKDSFKKELNENPLAYYIVAISGTDIVGYAGMWIIIDEGHITNIAVHPNYWNRGIGTNLIDNIITEAEKRDLIGLTLEVRQSNIKAQKLYTKVGFTPEGVRKGYYRDTGEDGVIMWKNL
ncbi:MAG: ribosomal protein S18-alanine N-acetyltransferase [Epulopiscium sp.]|nr:ribosomal protein S18-alanine N-acetyltransferase [Candidatus Epulonipiscium sp.]